MKERKIVIRPEAPQDQSAVFRVNELAFGQPNEARLVDALRPAARPYLSLVAVDDDQVTERIPGALRGRTGLVKYRPEFAEV